MSCISVVRRRSLILCADERRRDIAIGGIVGDGVITNSNCTTKEMMGILKQIGISNQIKKVALGSWTLGHGVLCWAC